MSRVLTLAIIAFTLFLVSPLYGQEADSLASSMIFDEFAVAEQMAPQADSTITELTIPNVFSPNKDGVNDYFEVETDGSTVYKFSIYTRAGIRVYYTVSPRIFWDGNSLDGVELSEGVYYYVISEDEGKESYSGFIHLFR